MLPNHQYTITVSTHVITFRIKLLERKW